MTSKQLHVVRILLYVDVHIFSTPPHPLHLSLPPPLSLSLNDYLYAIKYATPPPFGANPFPITGDKIFDQISV